MSAGRIYIPGHRLALSEASHCHAVAAAGVPATTARRVILAEVAFDMTRTLVLEVRAASEVPALLRLAFYDNIIVWSCKKKRYRKSAEAAPRQERAN
jgi:hypothetical protein